MLPCPGKPHRTWGRRFNTKRRQLPSLTGRLAWGGHSPGPGQPGEYCGVFHMARDAVFPHCWEKGALTYSQSSLCGRFWLKTKTKRTGIWFGSFVVGAISSKMASCLRVVIPDHCETCWDKSGDPPYPLPPRVHTSPPGQPPLALRGSGTLTAPSCPQEHSHWRSLRPFLTQPCLTPRCSGRTGSASS